MQNRSSKFLLFKDPSHENFNMSAVAPHDLSNTLPSEGAVAVHAAHLHAKSTKPLVAFGK